MKILLTTLHAKYVHASLALPSLAASIADFPGIDFVIREFTINEPRGRTLDTIISEKADVVAFSCYIWNIEETVKILDDLKQVAPDTFVILGGPEASHGVFELMNANPGIDCIIRGEGEGAFRDIIAKGGCTEILPDIRGIAYRDGEDIIDNGDREPVAMLDTLPSPFAMGLVNLNKPLVYYESSRGCPFSCAFCMSSLEKGVRTYSPERIRSDLAILMEREVGTVKFVDRTFNFSPKRSMEIWSYILRNKRASKYHFEVAADLLTDQEIALLGEVPEGLFRFEIGVQSGVERALERVERKSDLERLFHNVGRLLRETKVTIHLDLVAGLPHEDYAGFLASVDRLLAAGPHHIQVEPLKVLKGSPMRKIAQQEGYRFSRFAPYTILSTPWLDYDEVREMERTADALETFYNSGLFTTALRAISGMASPPAHLFRRLAHYRHQSESNAPLSRLSLFEMLASFIRDEEPEARHKFLLEALTFDFCRTEYPSGGSLPSFVDPDGQLKVDLPKPDTAPGTRVRIHARRFNTDFTVTPWVEGTTDILFRYISAPGKGLKVEVERMLTGPIIP